MSSVATVWARIRGGGYEPLGNIIPNSAAPSGLSWTKTERGGDDAFSCNVACRNEQLVPYLAAGTPIHVTLDGQDAWSGFLSRTPSTRGRDMVVTIEANGWYQSLNWQTVDDIWVVQGRTGFQDFRVHPGSQALRGSYFRHNGDVRTEYHPWRNKKRPAIIGGLLEMGWSKGTDLANPDYVGVIMDLGPNARAEELFVSWYSSNNTANISHNGKVSNTFDPTLGTALWTTALNSAASGTSSGTASDPGRYVYLYLHNTTVSAGITANYYWEIARVMIARSSSLVSGSNSVLTSDTVISDALTDAAPQISSDQSLIQTGATTIHEYRTPGRVTVAELIDAVNGYDGYQFFLDSAPTPRAVYRPRPTIPTYVIGAQEAYEFAEGDSNNIADIVNRVRVVYHDQEGLFKELTVRDGEAATGDATISNPSFTTNTTDWGYDAGVDATTISRVTSDFDTSPGCGQIAYTLGGSGVSYSYIQTGTGLINGKTYVLRGVYKWISGAGTASIGINNDATTPPSSGGGLSYFAANSVDVSQPEISWTPFSVVFTWDDEFGSDCLIQVTLGVASITIRIDSLELYELGTNPLDQSGIIKELVVRPEAAQDTTSARALANATLERYRVLPKRGDVSVTGTVRRFGTSARVPVGLMKAGELVLLEDIIDPTTRTPGYIAPIASLQYEHDAQTVRLTLDSETDIADQFTNDD